MRSAEAGEAQRLEAAAEWLLRLRTDADEQEIQRWVQWCEVDPRNQQAFDQVQRFWNLTGELADEASRSGAEATGSSAPRRRRRDFLAGWRNPLPAAAMACAVVLAVAGAWLSRDYLPTSRATLYSTEPFQKAHLADGSTVELAAKSSVTVQYGFTQRALELGSGEAYFSVAPNQRRPFVVTAGATRIRAIGTAFDVRRADDRVTVTVVHGIVEVFPADRDDAVAVRVPAGMQVRWRDGQQAPEVIPVNPASALAWREGRLEYTNEPLSGVVADLNRYSTQPVRLDGEAIKALRFSGSVIIRATDEWLQSLPASFPVSVGIHDGTYVIEARKKEG